MTNMAAIKEPPIIEDKQLFGYLQEMARQINYAIAQNEVEVKQVVRRTVEEVAEDPSSDLHQQMTEAAQKLRGLIMQTAKYTKIVDRIEQDLYEGKYVAYSDFGQVLDERVRTVTESSSGTTETYSLKTLIEAFKKADSDLRSYQVESTQYIKTGIIFDDGVNKTVGIAIGNAGSKSTVEGKEDEYEMTTPEYFASFTAGELAFWNGDPDSPQKVAWLDKTKLNISNAQINNELRVGHWLIKPDAGTGDLTISYQAG